MAEINLLEKIEQYREELATLVCRYGLSSEIVLQTSKELDVLINKYQKKSLLNT